MVVDTSALIAILADEPERAVFLERIEQADRGFLSALNLYEAQLVVLARLGQRGVEELTGLVDALGLSVVPFDRQQVDLCTAAYRRFGKASDRLHRSIFAIAPPMRLPNPLASPCSSR
jgi:ribonuclease VapC